MNLSDLLHDAVADVDPDDRLDEIRARTAAAAPGARRWYAAGGAALAVAAVVTAFAVVSPGPSGRPDAAGPPATGTQLVAVYFIGDAPGTPRLYREFDHVPAGDPLAAALQRLQQTPADPDYRTAWQPGSLREATVQDGRIVVRIDRFGLGTELARQQVVHTLQAAVGQRFPVSFSARGPQNPVVTQARSSVLSPVSISDPAEGNAYEGSMIARGRAASDQDRLRWQLRENDRVVRAGRAPLESGRGLRSWETEVDLDGLAPGSYVFTVVADDEGFLTRTVDTRTITVR